MNIEVIYALSNEQILFEVESSDSLTVKQAIEQSQLLVKYPDLSLDNVNVGIYGQIVELDHLVVDKDRIEIYRELTIDPKQARMLRAEKKRKKEGIRGFGA